MEEELLFSKIVERVETFTLSNSFKVLFYEEKNLPIVAINISFHTGSKDEKEGERGYAHLFEHLMFQGSLNFPNDFFKSLEKYGASINGGTSEDKTTYWEIVPKGALNYALNLEADRIKNLFPFVSEERLKNQIDVVKNEKRQVVENEPYGIADEAISELVFPEGHPYSHPVIGYFEDIQNATIEKMQKFFERFYTSKNGSIAICGDFDKDETFKVVEKLFGDVREGKFHPPISEWVPSIKGKRKLNIKSNVELKRVYYLWPTPSMFSKEDKSIFILTKILSRGKDSPLQNKLMVENPFCQSISASLFSGEVCGLFYITATLRDEKYENKVEEIIFKELEKVINDGFSKEELKSIFTTIESSLIRNLENLGGFGGLSDILNHYQLFYSDAKYIEKDFKELFSKGVEEIIGEAKKNISLDNFAKLSIEPKREKLIDINVNREVKLLGEFVLKKPIPIKGKGDKNFFVLMEDTLPYATVVASFKCGANEDISEFEGLLSTMVDLLDEGANGMTNVEISKELKSLGAFYETSVGYDDTQIFLSLPSKNLEKGFKILSDIIFKPDFKEDEVERIKLLKISSLKRDSKDPFEVAKRVSRLALFKEGEDYGKMINGRFSTLEKLDRKTIKEFYEENFSKKEMAFFLVGDVKNANRIETVYEDVNKTRNENPKNEVKEEREGGILYFVKMENIPSSEIVAFQKTIRRDDERFASISVFNTIFGGKFTSRLNQKMREEKGYTYGVRTYFSLQKGIMPWFLNATVEKGRTVEAIRDILQEFMEILNEKPPTEEEFEESRNGFLANYIRNFETQKLRATNFAKLFALELTETLFEETYLSLKKLTREEVIKNSREIFDHKKVSFAIVGDISQDELIELPFKEIVEIDKMRLF